MPAKALRPAGQNSGQLCVLSSLPIPHAQTTQEKCLSPFILVPFGYTSICAQCLPNPLPSSCLPVLPIALEGTGGSTEKQLQSSEECGGGGCCRAACILSGPAVTTTWFMGSLNSVLALSLANVTTDGFDFFFSPSLFPSSWGRVLFFLLTFLSLFVCEHPVKDWVCLGLFGWAIHHHHLLPAPHIFST